MYKVQYIHPAVYFVSPAVRTPSSEPLHSVGARLHTSWGSVGSDAPDECVVSTLERQHAANWSSRGTLGCISQRRSSTDQRDSAGRASGSTDASYGHLCERINFHSMEIQCLCVQWDDKFTLSCSSFNTVLPLPRSGVILSLFCFVLLFCPSLLWLN